MNKNKSFSLEILMRGVFLSCAAVSILAVLLICLFLFANGIPGIGKIGLLDFLTGTSWKPNDIPASFGILPMIVGSCLVTLGAISIGVPIGVASAVFMAFCCPKNLYKILKPAINLLAGIPSVIYGFFGMAAIVPVFGNSIISACILLGLMILPTVIGLSESALRAVPEQFYEGALALGSGHYRAVYRVALPAAKSGVMAAVVLGVGRAIGETMAVIMVAGNQARMPKDMFPIPKGLFRGIRTLTANIVIEMGYAAELHREALIATGVVLLIFILIINLCFGDTLRRKKQ
ncbi:MAG: phosphate ABC transporter permease subunit PstC [Clostridiales bacterium]|nr:phosphate ABC transporter permease subunit PstC [Clostridiales bacterium]